MASNFQVFTNKSRDGLDLQMYGNFDEISAYELINTLKQQSKNYDDVFIDTNDLETIHPFGLDEFQKQINRLTKNKICLIFIGNHRRRFAA